MSINFNEKSGTPLDASQTVDQKEDETPTGTELVYSKDVLEREIRTGTRTRFVYKPNPLVERDYQIFEYSREKNGYDHVGDYILVNKSETREATEQKLMNIMTMLNQKGDMIDVSKLTKKRLLYTMVPDHQSKGQTKMIFKEYDGKGVSKDNAVFTIRKGVFDG